MTSETSISAQHPTHSWDDPGEALDVGRAQEREQGLELDRLGTKVVRFMPSSDASCCLRRPPRQRNADANEAGVRHPEAVETVEPVTTSRM